MRDKREQSINIRCLRRDIFMPEWNTEEGAYQVGVMVGRGLLLTGCP